MPEATGNAGPNRHLYEHTSRLFDIRYAQKDYSVDANRFMNLAAKIVPQARTLLDVACGTGQHLQHFTGRYVVEGVDLNSDLLQIARDRLPGVELHNEDMTSFDLGRTYDIVTCLFASIPYLVTPARLRQAVASMAHHLAPGGILFIEPWLTPDVYRENEVVHNLRKTPDLTASWMYTQRREGDVAVWDIHWLIGTRDGGVQHVVEHEDLALYSNEVIEDAFTSAGLSPVRDAQGLHGYGAWVGRAEPWSTDEIALIHQCLSDE